MTRTRNLHIQLVQYLKILPQNSSFRIDILSHYDNFKLMWEWSDADWKNMTTALFIQIPDKSLSDSITQSLKKLSSCTEQRQGKISRVTRFKLIPLKDVGSNSRTTWSSGLFPSLHPAALVAPPIMALFILLIACFNFANTSIATFSKRLKEIGVKKNIWRSATTACNPVYDRDNNYLFSCTSWLVLFCQSFLFLPIAVCGVI